MGKYATVIDDRIIRIRIPRELEGFECRLQELYPEATIAPINRYGNYFVRPPPDINIRNFAFQLGYLLSD